MNKDNGKMKVVEKNGKVEAKHSLRQNTFSAFVSVKVKGGINANATIKGKSN